MAYKTSLILVAILLVPGCEKKPTPPPAKPNEAAAATDAGAEAKKAPTPAAAQDGGVDASPQEASATSGDAGYDGKKPPPPIPKVPMTQVITISMGAVDYDVFIPPDKTAYRLSMKPSAGDLAPLAARAKASPEAKDGNVKVFLGNSVKPQVGAALVDALRAAGFKNVSMELPRRP
jgi:hypothetical protein